MYSPKYSISNSILKYIGRIEASKEIIENAPLVPAYEAKFRQEAIIRTVHHGTHIEGNPLDTGEVAAVLSVQEINAKDRDIQEVLNYRNVLKFIDKKQETRNKKPEFSEKDLLTIHKLTVDRVLRSDQAGKFRKTQVVVKNSKTGKVSFTPPAADRVKELVADFLTWLNSDEAVDVHPVICAGIVHYVLAYVHPFVDGNGRTARAFATMVLFADGYDIKKFFSLEEHFDSDLGSYYDAFSKTDSQSEIIGERDLTYWLEYFTGGVAIELAKIKDRIKKLSIDNRLKGIIGTQVALTERQMKLVEHLSENGTATMQDLKNTFPMVSEDTVLRDVNYLIAKKIIKKEGKTKAARYVMANR